MQPSPPAPEVIVELPTQPPRPADSNKGNFGRVLVVAGSRGMSGAAVLCGSGALRGGAGLVRLAVPQEIVPIVAASNPCYMTTPLPQDDEGRIDGRAEAQLLELAQTSAVVALGPGLGQAPALATLTAALVARVQAPLVLDADGLNNVREQIDLFRFRPAPLVLTPHPGEFARLLKTDVPTVQARRQELAQRFAAEHGVVLLLKGHGTVVTDGRRVYRNPTGNPGMATGGSGDVLTGLIAALLGQGLEPFAAAQLGAYLHGLAGDLARDEVGEVGLVATDLIDFLPRAVRRHQAGQVENPSREKDDA
jgi:NAD(P)H-hydrate epimerase